MKLKLLKPVWKEKRESIRLELDCPAHFRRVETRWGFIKKKVKVASCLMLKPSMNGMRISTEQAIPQGSEVEIEVGMQKLGCNHAYVLAGRVMWSDYSGKTHRYEQGIKLSRRGPDTGRWERFMLERLRATDPNPKVYTFADKK